MKLKTILSAVIVGLCTASFAQDTLRIGIMQAKKGEAKKYAPLIAYMKTKGVTVKLVGTTSYDDAAKKFADGSVDAMFSGSGVAGAFIIKDLATPLVRPNSIDNWNTYWAVVVAPKGSPKFTGKESLKGKKVLCCSLASSGEFFVRAQYKGAKPDCEILKAKSHGAALSALARGAADLAVVKNRVWDSIKKDPRSKGIMSKLEVVGRHAGENPNGTLIVSKTLNADLVNKVKDALLAVEADKSEAATKLKKSLKIDKYIITTVEDFKFTIPLLKDAGVSKDFNFSF